MKTFNIYGERNSGTHFLYAFISTNFDLKGSRSKKHSFIKEYNAAPDHINFCIVRNLNDWAHSSYNNPYHLANPYKNSVTILEFINGKTVTDCHTPSTYNINLDDTYNLVELRYIKYNSYKKITNKILVNLDFLQYSNSNKKDFLKGISKKYNLKRKTFNPIITYRGGQGKGYERTAKFNILKYPKLNYSEILSYNKELEEEINNLTFLL